VKIWQKISGFPTPKNNPARPAEAGVPDNQVSSYWS
jgi:hypothetical protein